MWCSCVATWLAVFVRIDFKFATFAGKKFRIEYKYTVDRRERLEACARGGKSLALGKQNVQA